MDIISSCVRFMLTDFVRLLDEDYDVYDGGWFLDNSRWSRI